MKRGIAAGCKRAAARFAAPLILVATGAVAGCSGNHLNAIPSAPQPEAPPEQQAQSGSVQYRLPEHGLQVVRGHVRPEMLSASLVGSLPPRQKLHLAIGLPLRDRAAVQTLLDALADPHSGNRHYLTPAEFQARFSPSDSDYQSAIAFARAAGLTITRTYPGRVVLDVEGDVATIQRAFHVTMQTRRRSDGSLFYAPSNEPELALRTPILHIAGLDNEDVPKPAIASIRPIGMARTRERMRPNASGPGGTFAGSDFRNAYATNAPEDGTAECIGLLEFDSSFFPSDISAYQTQFGLQHLVPQTVLLDGYNGVPQVGKGEEETALDIEVSQAMAPGMNQMFVYEGSLTDSIFAAMTSGQLCGQLSASWTFGVDATSQQLVDQMALQGQSLFVASGDGGGFLKDTKDDRDLSNTAVVGGTELTLNADDRWQSETAWSGSGGGVETTQYQPPFQHGLKLARGSTPHKRMLPDVAMVADNVFLIADQGQGLVVAGTSIATPLWAGYGALINQHAHHLGFNAPPLGFPDPPLYAIARNPGLYASNFHDITSGNNGAFSTLPGYDLVTGWGSPQPGLIDALTASPFKKNFTQLQIVVFTGNDDLRSDSDLQVSFKGVANLGPFCLMRSNNGKPSGWCTGNEYGDVNHTQGWPDWSTQTLTFTNRFANWKWSGSGTMTLTMTSHNNGFETNDNWDLQAMSVILSNPSTNQTVTLFDSGNFNAPHNPGNCYWRFIPTGSPPTIQQTFNLLPGSTPSNGCPGD
jgi:kumamolisin